MRIAVVVQRYGTAVNGGAELHARYIAEHLARHVEVDVVTTCATDYVTWRNELAAGVEQLNGVAIRRFPVARERDPLLFGRLSDHVFGHRHSLADELRWLEAEGPTSSSLIRYIAKNANSYDYWIFFSYRYYHAYHGVRAVPSRAVLVPTAERDPAIGMSLFSPIFNGVRAIMYNSPEEQAMIQARSGNADVASVVVGVGSDIPQAPRPDRFRQKHGIREPFAIYVGRIDENKGCQTLFEFFESYRAAEAGRLSLVLIGQSLLSLPQAPWVRYLGFLDDVDKFDAMAASELLIMPSHYESLSMVALEAWALGRPVLANGACDVLKGQCLRSNAGLYYADVWEFAEALSALEHNGWLNATLGRNGRRFFREHYDWPVIERKYLDILHRLSATPPAGTLEPLPGWLARRRPDCPAAADVVAGLPRGPVVPPVPSSGSPPEFPSPRPTERVPAQAPAGSRPRGHFRRDRPGRRMPEPGGR